MYLLVDWELFHSGPSVISALGDVVPMDMGYKLPVDINSHAFSKYTSVYFKVTVTEGFYKYFKITQLSIFTCTVHLAARA